ncbi:MAG: DUF308 domain-containing protein [Polyangiaceae bacterium]|nr:DUF308 domain-containing protein [Polyangiaceae bacterium]
MTVPNPFKPSFTSDEQTRGRMTFVGITLLVLGVIAILAPIASTFVAAIVIGVLLIAGGVLRLFHGFEDPRRHGIGWLIVSSILYVLAGIAILWTPLIGALSLTLVIGVLFVVSAVSKAIRSFQFRGTGSSGWLLFDAVISGALGILLVAGLPGTAFWTLGVIVGVDLIMGGIISLGMAGLTKPVTSSS